MLALVKICDGRGVLVVRARLSGDALEGGVERSRQVKRGDGSDKYGGRVVDFCKDFFLKIFY